MLTQGKRPRPLSPFRTPKELALKLRFDPQTLSLSSTDYGDIVHKNSSAVLEPTCVNDIIELIKFSNSLPIPITIAARGQAHSAYGQAMTHNGVVVNMTNLGVFRNGSGIIVNYEKAPYYADVGGEQIWIDVLHATLKHGLTPFAWTNYLYLSVGGTLSNAGINGRAFRFGPQISNVLELDVVTGKGDLVTCSAEKNSEAFYAVLGGLGQFGVITRARIALGPAPTRVKWLQLLYNEFSVFSEDQEHLISSNERNDTKAADFVSGSVLLNHPPLELSFFPADDQPRITSLVTQYGIVYILEIVKYYDNNSQANITEEVANLVKGLMFLPTFVFEKDVSYEEFLNRLELPVRSQGLLNLSHPWLYMLVPKSRISDFNEGVFKGIVLKKNITGSVQIFPMNRNKWDTKMSAVTPDEDVFYGVGFFHATTFDQVETFQDQNQQVLQFCKDAGIKIKEYLPFGKTHEEWVEHFGSKWKLFEGRKAEFDPRRILSPGQRIFN